MGIWVISRTTYMATWRALEMLAERLLERMSSGLVPYVRATSSMIFSTVTGTGCSLLMMSLTAICAVGQVEGVAVEQVVRLHLLDRALQLADVVLQPVGDVFDHVVRQVDAEQLRLALDDRDARFKIRRLDVRGQAPLKPGEQALFQGSDVPWADGRM